MPNYTSQLNLEKIDVLYDVNYNEQTDTWSWRITETVPVQRWWNKGKPFNDHDEDHTTPAYTS